MLLLALLGSADAGVVRHALVVGSNDGGSVLTPLQYAEQDAERIQQVLSELGGFAPENITLLMEPGRDELTAQLEKHAGIAAAHEEDMFVFYYSGHATARGLKLGDETLPYEELRQSMNELPSEVRLGVLDACRSGEITRLKGLTLSEPFATDDTLSAEGEAWLTASSADEDAQESDHIQGSFFTHYLVSGLRGAADQDDGVVSLSEAYAYAYDQTVSRTGRTDAGTQHPSYNFRIQGEGDLPLTDVRQASATVILPESMTGRFTVLSVPDETPLVEVSKKPDVRTVVALPPGRYLIRLKTSTQTVEAPLGLTEGANHYLSERVLIEQPEEVASLKGIGPEAAPADSMPPPLLYDPDAPRLLEDPGGAVAAGAERFSEHLDYQGRRLNTQLIGWLEQRRVPGTTVLVSTVSGEDVERIEQDSSYHYRSRCEGVGMDCLHSAGAAEQVDGTATLTYADGTVAAEGYLMEGIPSGPWAFYYEDGSRHSTGELSNGVTVGDWTWWYPNGQKRMKGTLQGSDVRTGTWMEWYDSGKRKSRTEYENGAVDGRKVEWFPSGQKKSEGRMIGDRMHGEWTFYSEDGQKTSQGTYTERGRSGTWTTWHDNGVKASKGRYVENLQHGRWIQWHDNGNLKSEGDYSRGRREGRWETWHDNGQPHTRVGYRAGALQGRYFEWDTAGRSVARGYYSRGERDRRWTFWAPDGSRRTEVFSATAATTEP